MHMHVSRICSFFVRKTSGLSSALSFQLNFSIFKLLITFRRHLCSSDLMPVVHSHILLQKMEIHLHNNKNVTLL